MSLLKKLFEPVDMTEGSPWQKIVLFTYYGIPVFWRQTEGAAFDNNRQLHYADGDCNFVCYGGGLPDSKAAS